jgi:hypothetical protein
VYELFRPFIVPPRPFKRLDIDMPDGETKWYASDPNDPRFTQDIVDLLKETHGADHAHLYALERVLRGQEMNNEHEVNLWRGILTALDREKNYG